MLWLEVQEMLLALVFAVLAPAGAEEPAPLHVDVPPYHLPPEGKCRVWYADTPAHQQPRAVDCERIDLSTVRDAWLVHDGTAWKIDHDWKAYARENPGRVPEALVGGPLELAGVARSLAEAPLQVKAPDDPTQCRIWYRDLRPEEQVPAGACSGLKVPSDRIEEAWVIHDGKVWEAGADWARWESLFPDRVPDFLVTVRGAPSES